MVASSSLKVNFAMVSKVAVTALALGLNLGMVTSCCSAFQLQLEKSGKEKVDEKKDNSGGNPKTKCAKGRYGPFGEYNGKPDGYLELYQDLVESRKTVQANSLYTILQTGDFYGALQSGNVELDDSAGITCSETEDNVLMVADGIMGDLHHEKKFVPKIPDDRRVHRFSEIDDGNVAFKEAVTLTCEDPDQQQKTLSFGAKTLIPRPPEHGMTYKIFVASDGKFTPGSWEGYLIVSDDMKEPNDLLKDGWPRLIVTNPVGGGDLEVSIEFFGETVWKNCKGKLNKEVDEKKEKKKVDEKKEKKKIDKKKDENKTAEKKMKEQDEVTDCYEDWFSCGVDKGCLKMGFFYWGLGLLVALVGVFIVFIVKSGNNENSESDDTDSLISSDEDDDAK